jgi:hypothetical protein
MYISISVHIYLQWSQHYPGGVAHEFTYGSGIVDPLV